MFFQKSMQVLGLIVLLSAGCRHNCIYSTDVSGEEKYRDVIGTVYSLPLDSYMLSDPSGNGVVLYLTCSNRLFGDVLPSIDRSIVGRSFRESTVVEYFPKGTVFKLSGVSIEHSRIGGLEGEREMLFIEIKEHKNVLIDSELIQLIGVNGGTPYGYSSGENLP